MRDTLFNPTTSTPTPFSTFKKGYRPVTGRAGLVWSASKTLNAYAALPAPLQMAMQGQYSDILKGLGEPNPDQTLEQTTIATQQIAAEMALQTQAQAEAGADADADRSVAAAPGRVAHAAPRHLAGRTVR